MFNGLVCQPVLSKYFTKFLEITAKFGKAIGRSGDIYIMDIHIFIMLNNDINSKTYGTKLFSGIYKKIIIF
jgi:hypothetical protein